MFSVKILYIYFTDLNVDEGICQINVVDFFFDKIQMTNM